ncbi:tripartite tricarboxylate transporter TctB family protein [Pinisolibacter sp.]|uniref:tripartite tricarboxylate transporter TctB family protein n=1 Tax=Pinisolibacter sp. TaxID=2172024 RepID=UPI002FDEC9C2
MTETTGRLRDVLAGATMTVIGLAVVFEARTYQIGSLTRMGPGYLPVVLGGVLAGIGVVIALRAWASDRIDVHTSDRPGHTVAGPLDLRGGAAIVAGVLAFIALGAWAGLVPATFACVLIAALGDRSHGWRRALTLAAVVTVLGVGLFSFGLKVSFPLFRW